MKKTKLLSIVLAAMMLTSTAAFTGCEMIEGFLNPTESSQPNKPDSSKKEEVKVKSISLAIEAENTKYIAGDVFNPAGITLTATYTDGSKKNVTEGFDYDKTPLKEGATSVKITYEGCETEQAIAVSSASDALILLFGSGDKIRCYGNGLVVVGGVQIESYTFKDGDDSLASNFNAEMGMVTCNVGTWSWDGEKITMVINNHTEDIVCKVSVDLATNTCKFDEAYPFVDYAGQTYNFGGSASEESVAKYLTADRRWPVVEEE